MNAPAPDAAPDLTALVRRLRHLEIRIRKAVEAQLQGDFHSVFKGTGLEFDDVRLYQYGDEVRAIDWAVSSKGHGTFVKTYKEEKEQQVLVLLDVSASQEVSDGQRRKLDVGRDIAGLLALSAARQGAALGLLAFSDPKGAVPAPRPRGRARPMRSSGGCLGCGRPRAARRWARASGRRWGCSSAAHWVVLISDFIDADYERELTMLAQRHDLLVVQLLAPRERTFPALGIVPLQDAETGRTRWVNTSAPAFRARYEAAAAQQQAQLANLCRRQRTAFLALSTEGDFVPQLVELFRRR